MDSKKCSLVIALVSLAACSGGTVAVKSDTSSSVDSGVADTLGTPETTPADTAPSGCVTNSDCGGTNQCVGGVCQAATTCQNSLDCSNGLVCTGAGGQCVQCVAATDCPQDAATGFDCVLNQCVVHCTSSLQCSTGNICDPVTNRCEQCAADADCTTGTQTKCVANTCTTPCVSDNQCTPNGQLCQKTLGGCVQCNTATDCPTNSTCSAAYTCVASGGGDSGVPDTATGDTSSTLHIIEDFSTCANPTTSDGTWTLFGTSYSTTPPLGVQVPGGAWNDQTCGAFMTGGSVTTGDVGFKFVPNSVLNLSAYTGLQVNVESQHDLQVTLKTAGASYVVTLPGVVGNTVDHQAPFSSFTPAATGLNAVTEIDFSPQGGNVGVGFGIHLIAAY